MSDLNAWKLKIEQEEFDRYVKLHERKLQRDKNAPGWRGAVVAFCAGMVLVGIVAYTWFVVSGSYDVRAQGIQPVLLFGGLTIAFALGFMSTLLQYAQYHTEQTLESQDRIELASPGVQTAALRQILERQKRKSNLYFYTGMLLLLSALTLTGVLYSQYQINARATKAELQQTWKTMMTDSGLSKTKYY